MRWALRTSWLMRAGALALALAAASLAGCGDSDDESGGYDSYPREWEFGGQTGSLMPACGLSAEAIENGVPASAPGVVLRLDNCNDPNAFNELTVRDASGQPVAFNLIRLPDGSLLIDIQGGLVPGRYSIDVGGSPVSDAGMSFDDDGGVEPDEDASVEPQLPDAGLTPSFSETIEVASERPRPRGFGSIERVGDECNADLTFVPDVAVLPFLSVLSVDLQIDEGPVLPLVRPGALPVLDGTADVRLPTERIEAAGDGTHTLRITTRIAGESMPLETFLLSVEQPCGYTYDGSMGSTSSYDDGGGCAVSTGGGRHASSIVLVGLALFALRRRRRRKRA